MGIWDTLKQNAQIGQADDSIPFAKGSILSSNHAVRHKNARATNQLAMIVIFKEMSEIWWNATVMTQ